MSQVVSDVCGVQAQVLSGAALSLWARLNSITIQDVEDALWKHWILVKTWAMRGTLHLLSSNSLSTYVAALKTRQDLYHEKISYRIGPGPADKKYQITRAEQEQVAKAIYDALDGHVLTREELAREITNKTTPYPPIPSPLRLWKPATTSSPRGKPHLRSQPRSKGNLHSAGPVVGQTEPAFQRASTENPAATILHYLCPGNPPGLCPLVGSPGTRSQSPRTAHRRRIRTD